MPRYRVTLRVNSVDVVEADNPYMAAIAASEKHGNGIEVTDVRLAVGRLPNSSAPAKKAHKVAKKRRPLSAEARAKLAKNLEKARAVRARNLRAAKNATKKRTVAR